MPAANVSKVPPSLFVHVEVPTLLLRSKMPCTSVMVYCTGIWEVTVKRPCVDKTRDSITSYADQTAPGHKAVFRGTTAAQHQQPLLSGRDHVQCALPIHRRIVCKQSLCDCN